MAHEQGAACIYTSAAQWQSQSAHLDETPQRVAFPLHRENLVAHIDKVEMLERRGGVARMVELSKCTTGLHLVLDKLLDFAEKDALWVEAVVCVHSVSSCKKACRTTRLSVTRHSNINNDCTTVGCVCPVAVVNIAAQ
jgi:hypothetical protein